MIKLIKSTFYHEAETKRSLVDFINRAEFLSMADECQKFEKHFAEKQQRRFAVFVSSGSMANLVLTQAMKNLNRWRSGNAIGFSSLTWPTNVMPLIQLGLLPVPIDCELSTLNVSPRTLAPVLDRLDGLFITNVLGFSDQLDQIAELCRKRNIALLEDNCEALGSQLNGRLLGNFGLASTFSFFVGHHLSTIEGGMICTDDDELHDMLIMVRAHGWDRNLAHDKQQELRLRHKIDNFYDQYTFYDLAFNARPSEVNGFIGNAQLPYLDEIVSKRQTNFRRLQRAQAQNTRIIPLQVDHLSTISNFAMPMIFRQAHDFQRMKQKLAEHQVEIRPIIAGDITQQPFYRKYFPVDSIGENSQLIHQQGLYFANNPDMTEAELQTLERLVVE